MQHTVKKHTPRAASIITPILTALILLFACFPVPANADVMVNLRHIYPDASQQETKLLSADISDTLDVDLVNWAQESYGGKTYPLVDAKIVSIITQYEVRYYKDVISEDTLLSRDHGRQTVGEALPAADHVLRGAAEFTGIHGFDPLYYQSEPMLTGNVPAVENPAQNIVNVVFTHTVPDRTTYTVRCFYADTREKILNDQTFGQYNYPWSEKYYVGQTVSIDEVIANAQSEVNYTVNKGHDTGSYRMRPVEISPDISITLTANASSNVVDVYYEKLVNYRISHMQQTGSNVWVGIAIEESYDLIGTYFSADHYYREYQNHVMAGRYSPAAGEMYLVENNPKTNNRLAIYYDWKPGYTGARTLLADGVGTTQALSFPVTLYGGNIYGVELTYESGSTPGGTDDSCEGDCGSGCGALPFAGALGLLTAPFVWFAVRRRK